jgi:hypothetical protein
MYGLGYYATILGARCFSFSFSPGSSLSVGVMFEGFPLHSKLCFEARILVSS